jgi:hypothetical protein
MDVVSAPRTSETKRTRAWTLAALSTCCALSCGDLLGIEQAHVDPSLSAVNAGGSVSVAGMFGSGLVFSSGGQGSSGAPGFAGTGGTESNPAASGGTSPSALGGSGDGAGAGGGGAGGAATTLCEEYCDTIGEYCSGDQLQYGDIEQCRTVCALLPEGALGEEDRNSVACRLKYAGKARYAGGVELAAYCRQAGPGGDDRCGSNCEGYCSIMMTTCTRELGTSSYYTSLSECLRQCDRLPDAIPYSWSDPDVADGSSVQCRLFHVISAAMADREEHCEHAYGLTLCEAPN